MSMADDEGVIATAEDSLATPLLRPTAVARDPFVEVRLYRQGAGPVALFRSCLAGPRRDRLDVRRIQGEHGLRALFAFKPGDSRRGLRIRADPAAGYSALPFRDGAVIVLDGEPKESWTKPVSVIVAGVLVPAVMAMVAVNGVPEQLRSSKVVNGLFPPWILISAVIIFARVRTRPRAP
ncbi:hypothetical protein QOZ80_1AG0012540 [Eleusine coracana subsp. coracana]|nr:hypothetical protein QOZ80_1AG0012540 [Eleusine coracana subsp. coracana]